MVGLDDPPYTITHVSVLETADKYGCEIEQYTTEYDGEELTIEKNARYISKFRRCTYTVLDVMERKRLDNRGTELSGSQADYYLKLESDHPDDLKKPISGDFLMKLDAFAFKLTSGEIIDHAVNDYVPDDLIR